MRWAGDMMSLTAELRVQSLVSQRAMQHYSLTAETSSLAKNHQRTFQLRCCNVSVRQRPDTLPGARFRENSWHKRLAQLLEAQEL